MATHRWIGDVPRRVSLSHRRALIAHHTAIVAMRSVAGADLFLTSPLLHEAPVALSA